MQDVTILATGDNFKITANTAKARDIFKPLGLMPSFESRRDDWQTIFEPYGLTVKNEWTTESKIPNGLVSLLETHFEIVFAIASHMEGDHWDEDADNRLATRWREQGTGGLYELAHEMAEAFETEYAGVEWGVDDDFQTRIEEFININLFL